jgi:hypothetical protein
MNRFMWVPPEITKQVPGMDPEGAFLTEKEVLSYDNVVEFDILGEIQKLKIAEGLKRLKSDQVKELIDKTINGEFKWEFVWTWFTAGFAIPTFIVFNEARELIYRAQVAWPPQEWGYIIIVSTPDGTYDSVIDDELYPQAGMELWLLIEELCINKEYFQDELRKEEEARKEERVYPTLEDLQR